MGNILKVTSAFSAQGIDVDEVRGYWIQGKPGYGKSHYAREVFTDGGLFSKAQNKWWDGY